jgi:hypothetical protein
VKLKFVMAFAATVVALTSVPVVAHHTATTLYSDKTVTMKGTVKGWRWSNPHCLLTFEVKGEDGQVVQWLAETQAPNTVYAEGYRPNSFKPDDQITVTVRPAANGRPFGLLTQALLPDGTKLGDATTGGRGTP